MGQGECYSYTQYDTKYQNEWQNVSSAKVYVEYPRHISE